MDTIYLDASDQVVGRIASIVAKRVLSGDTVAVVNAEKAVIIGNPKAIVESYKARRERGDPYHGPFYPRHPDRILKRTIRGMLPYKTPRGREAFKRLKVFNTIPDDLAGKEFSPIVGAKNKGEQKQITLAGLVEKL